LIDRVPSVIAFLNCAQSGALASIFLAVSIFSGLDHPTSHLILMTHVVVNMDIDPGMSCFFSLELTAIHQR
jgi:hypothetical protein